MNHAPNGFSKGNKTDSKSNITTFINKIKIYRLW